MSTVTAPGKDDIDVFFDLLEETYGRRDYKEDFRVECASGQRLGQAFCSVLPMDIYTQIAESDYDPFYDNGWPAILRAIDYLTGGLA